jgi:hypothetical protein
MLVASEVVVCSTCRLTHTGCLYVRALHRTSKPKTKRRCLGPKLNGTLDTAAAVQSAYCYLKYTRSNLMVRTAGTADRKHRLAAAIPPKGKTWQSANTDQQQLLQLHMTHDPNKMPVRNATCMHNANSMRRTQSTCSAQGTALQTVDNATSAHCRIPQVARVHCTMPQPCTSTLPSACTSCTISHTMPMALSLSVLLSGLCPCGASVRGRGFGHFATTKCHPV